MIPDPAIVTRLGFEAWADNLIVNAIETLGAGVEANDSYSIRVEKHPGGTNYIVRAYVQGQGWLIHSREIKEGKKS